MKLSEIFKAIPFIHEIGMTPLLIGDSGVGKTEATRQYAEENGFELIEIRLGQLADSGDLTGLPDFVKDGKGNAIATKFMPPDFLPKGDKPTIIFLDEINRCTKDLLQAVFQMVEKEGRIGQYIFPKNTKVIAACNPPGENYTVLDFQDVAFQNRFVHLPVIPDNDDWLTFMRKTNKHPAVVDFIAANPNMLSSLSHEVDLSVLNRTHRIWDRVASLLSTKLPSELELPVISGMIGPESALLFLKYKQEAYSKFDLLKTLDNPDVKALRESTIDKLNVFISELTDLFTNLEGDEKNIYEKDSDNYTISSNSFMTKERALNFTKIMTNLPVDLCIGALSNFMKLQWFVTNRELSSLSFVDEKMYAPVLKQIPEGKIIFEKA